MRRGKRPEEAPVEDAPRNIEAEQALLGAILISNKAFDAAALLVEPQDFSEPLHARIFELMHQAVRQNLAFTPITLKPYLPADLTVGDMSVGEYLAYLAEASGPVMNVPDYAKAVRDIAIRRRMMQALTRGLRLAREADIDSPPWQMLEDVEADLATISADAAKGRALDMRSAIDRSMDALHDAYKGGKISGWSWRLPEVEQVLDSRIESGNLIGLLGGSSEGKTAFILEEARYQAEQGVHVLFLSGEQPLDQCINQLHAQKLGISARDIKNGLRRLERAGGQRAVDEAYQKIAADKEALKNIPLVIQAWDNATAEQLVSRARNYERQVGKCLVILDHAQAVTHEDPRAPFSEQITAIFRPFKRFTMGAKGSAMIVLLQRNMDAKGRDNPVPTRGDIYGGDRARQAFDLVLALYRPEVWVRERLKLATTEAEKGRLGSELSRVEGKAELHSLKSRGGDDSRHKRIIEFEGAYTRFRSIARVTTAEDDAIPLPLL